MSFLSKLLGRTPAVPPPPVPPTILIRSAFARGDAEGWNPLRGMTVDQVLLLYDAARGGDYSWIQRIYAEIERADPVLKVCVARRKGAMSNFALRAVTGEIDGDHETLAKEQEAAIREMVLGADNLAAAMEHLESASFRGFAHIAPIYDTNGAIKSYDLLDSWNISRRGSKGPWLWNPESKSGIDGLQEIPEGETVWIEDEAIDYPALQIYIAKALAVRDWGRFVENFGIPPCSVIMPQQATEADQNKYLESARAYQQGANNVWPFGTQVDWASEARGVEPFSKLLQHLSEQIVLMATGGTLTSLSASGAGTLAGGAHEETWQQVTARSRRINADALFRGAAKPILQNKFLGNPILARIEYDDVPKPTPGEILDFAVKAKQAGYEFTTEELNRLTSFSLEKAPEPQPPAPQPPNGGSRLLNSANKDVPDAKLTTLADARKKDFATVAGAIDKLLSADDTDIKTKAGALAKNLPSALGKMNAVADVLEGEMAAAFAGDGNDRVKNEACPADGGFLSKDGNCTHPNHKSDGGAEGAKGVQGKSHAEKSAQKVKNKAEGVKNMAEVEAGKDSPNFMKSPKGKNIAFYQGDSKSGYKHIADVAITESNHAVMLKDNNIPDALAYGTYYSDRGGVTVVHNDKMVVLKKVSDKGYSIITAYEDKNQAAQVRRNERLENSRGDVS